MRKVIRHFLLPFILIYCSITLAQTKIDRTVTFSTHSFFPSKELVLVTHSNPSIFQKKTLAKAAHVTVNKKWQKNFNVSDQVKISLGLTEMPTPFLMVNTMGSSNSSNILLEKYPILFSNQGNQLRLVDNNWVIRGIFGLDSQPLFNHLIAGLGVGAAVINKNLNSQVMFSNFSYFENNQTSIRPSFLASATWVACPTCLAGHGGSISFQVAVDQSPVMGEENFSFQPTINQKWQWSETLVFNVRI